jgi:hypothetical protein
MIHPFPVALRGATSPLGSAEQSPHIEEGTGAVRAFGMRLYVSERES